MNKTIKEGFGVATEKEFEARVEINDMFHKSTTKQIIIKALKEAREGKGTLSLRDIAEILKEVLSDDEIITLIINLKNEKIKV